MRLVVLTVLALQAVSGVAAAGGGSVEVVIRHMFDGRPLVVEDVSYRTRGGNTISVSRLDYLISEVRLVSRDGGEVPVGREAEYLSFGASRNGFVIREVPEGEYSGLRFRVGLAKELNHSDPASRGAYDPLHPVFNGLHWGWQGGYVFAALEGRYELPGSMLGGYSYHIGGDELQMLVQLDGELRVTEGTKIELGFDVAKVLPESLRIGPDDGSDSTHSAEGDALAVALAAGLPGAFSLRRCEVGAGVVWEEEPERAARPEGTTAYELAVPRHFPAPFLPVDNPLTREGIELGRRLFNETALSGDGTQSCASCHHMGAAFADPGRALSLGVLGKPGNRNAMPLFNLAWDRTFTWDGKRVRLRDQALAPIQDAREMNQSLPAALDALSRTEGYSGAFATAFGSEGITAERLGLAIEQYLLTLVAAESKYDRVRRGEASFTEQERRGMELFSMEFDPARGKRGADCFHCHGGELFTDHRFRNNGLDVTFTDRGRAEVTGRDRDAGRFKTPSLRNVEVTGPYMHDGRFATLDEAIAHYAGGVHRTPTLDANLAKHKGRGVELSELDRQALKAFLLTLTDDGYRGEAAK